MSEQCKLVHVRCSSCGNAIHQDGCCACADNRKHPIAKLEQDRVTQLENKIERLQEIVAKLPVTADTVHPCKFHFVDVDGFNCTNPGLHRAGRDSTGSRAHCYCDGGDWTDDMPISMWENCRDSKPRETPRTELDDAT